MVNGLSISWNDSWNETSKMLWEGNVHKGSPTILVNFQHTYRTYPYHLPQKTHTYLFFLRLKCWWKMFDFFVNFPLFLSLFPLFPFFLWYIGRPIFADIPTYLVPFCLILLEIPTYPKIGRPLWTFPYIINRKQWRNSCTKI